MKPEIQMTTIGEISQGIDGRDQYVRLRSVDDDIDLDHAHNWLLEMFYRESLRPGGYFCDRVTIVPLPYNTSECIGIIYHRYDV
jgi:hypothetical protein